ncbi:MAG: HAD-IA family hydrolase [Deltaproteobacteria bacterium]|nr:HAD-IA family hydrolase [Deltaproteobacteria bacterium]
MIPIYEGMKGLIFDCDGTLADTMTIHTQSWQETMKQFGHDCPVDFLQPLRGIPAEEIVIHFNRAFGTDLDIKEVSDAKNRMSYDRLKTVKPIVPVAKIALDYRGKLPMSVVSGGTRKNVLRTLEAIGMADFFEAVITADDALRPKPDPQMFIEAAKRMAVPSVACEVFEDGDPGLEAARAAGMKFVDVRSYVNLNRFDFKRSAGAAEKG